MLNKISIFKKDLINLLMGLRKFIEKKCKRDLNFRFYLLMNEKILTDLIDIMAKMVMSDFNGFITECDELFKKYCTEEKKEELESKRGTAIFYNLFSVQVLNDSQYIKEFDALKLKYKDVFKKTEDFFYDKIEIELYSLKLESIPEDIEDELFKILLPLVNIG